MNPLNRSILWLTCSHKIREKRCCIFKLFIKYRIKLTLTKPRLASIQLYNNVFVLKKKDINRFKLVHNVVYRVVQNWCNAVETFHIDRGVHVCSM